MMKKVFGGFTLAEILITLGIIGVVAAILIPTTMEKVQDWQLKQAWKKQYSILNQVYNEIISENGGTIKGAFPHDNWIPDSQKMITLFKDKMKVVKYCPSINSAGSGCWHAFPGVGYDNLTVRDKQGDMQSFFGSGYPAIVLTDGTLIYIPGVNIEGYNFSGISNYGQIVIDVNGFKKPNVIGKDIFQILILDDKLSPFGVLLETNTCDTTGQGCAAEYLYK